MEEALDRVRPGRDVRGLLDKHRSPIEDPKLVTDNLAVGTLADVMMHGGVLCWGWSSHHSSH